MHTSDRNNNNNNLDGSSTIQGSPPRPNNAPVIDHDITGENTIGASRGKSFTNRQFFFFAGLPPLEELTPKMKKRIESTAFAPLVAAGTWRRSCVVTWARASGHDLQVTLRTCRYSAILQLVA